ncbi:hypothetical protein ACLEEB_15320 [Lonsdalea quercina]|uniref:hypothetical protein n=1 Tax=Lonsdalea quercina TaxID=71657 RepID=UPI0039756192
MYHNVIRTVMLGVLLLPMTLSANAAPLPSTQQQQFENGISSQKRLQQQMQQDQKLQQQRLNQSIQQNSAARQQQLRQQQQQTQQRVMPSTTP